MKNSKYIQTVLFLIKLREQLKYVSNGNKTWKINKKFMQGQKNKRNKKK